MIKTHRGRNTGLHGHMKHHNRQGAAIDRDKWKAWLIASMVTVLNIPLNVFNSITMEILFWLARLGVVNDDIARTFTDAEAARLEIALATDIKELLKEGTVFTLTCDEWTWSRKRFIGVTLHSSKVIPCLGGPSIAILSRFRSRASAKNLKDSLLEALDSIGSDLPHIRGITTDAALVMKRLGQMLIASSGDRPFYHQLCYAHGLHLAVIDTLSNDSLPMSYPLSKSRAAVEGSEDSRWHMVRIDREDVEGGAENEARVQDPSNEDEFAAPADYLGTNGALINRVRAETRKFQKSPVSNDELMQCAEASLQASQLVLDNRTRWNSVLEMLRCFVKFEPALREFYARSNKVFPFTAEVIDGVRNIICSLAHVERAVLRLSAANATLMDAEVAIEVMLENLPAESSPFSKLLHSNLCVRVLQRRGVMSMSRLSRFVVGRKEHTDFDEILDGAREELEKEGKATVINSLEEPGDIMKEIERFSALENDGLGPPGSKAASPTTSKDGATPVDKYGAFEKRQSIRASIETSGMSASRMMKYHRRGVRALPETFMPLWKLCSLPVSLLNGRSADVMATKLPREAR